MVMAEIGGPLAHQLPLHNHRGGLVQPSLVMNHHLDLDCHGPDIHQSKFTFVSCAMNKKTEILASFYLFLKRIYQLEYKIMCLLQP